MTWIIRVAGESPAAREHSAPYSGQYIGKTESAIE